MVSKLFTALAAAGVAAAAGTNAKFNAYWGQSGPPNESLRQRCDEGADYISLSFVTSSPEKNPDTGYPGINFAAHCWADVFEVNGKKSKLYSHCGTIKDDLQYCRDKGIKMLLAIGGEWNENTADYRVTTEEKGREFADFLWKAFGPHDPSWPGPRPFDKSAIEHSAIDGFDFDLELPKENGKHFDNKPWIAMIDQFRKLSKDVFITGAPQCPTADEWFSMKEMIQKAQFDALFIQFYNNPGCDLKNANFNYKMWEDIIARSDKSKNAKLFVGIPASDAAASSGYIAPKDLEKIICSIAKKPSFGGISIWDMFKGLENVVDGKSFNEHVKDILSKCGKQTATSTTSSTTSISTAKTASSSSIATTSTSTVLTSTPSSIHSTVVPSGSNNTSSALPTISSSSVKLAGTGNALSSSSVQLTGTGSSRAAVPTPGTASVPSGSHSSLVHSSVAATTTTPRVTVAPWSNSTTTSQEMTTSTVYTTATRTITDCPPSVTNCPARVVTETIALYTTVCPVTKTNHIPPKPTAKPSQPTEEMTTSSVYTTKTYTITSCPPSVPNCPVGHVTTETIFVSTTVCPVTKTDEAPKPTAKPSQPTEEMTTSSVYTTKTYTITSCPPIVPDCPVGHVTTETIFVSTTVCPVTKTDEAPKPTAKPIQPTEEMTTSSVYTTKTYTITSCPPSVPNCPVGHVTTETKFVSTTVCPVADVPQPTHPAGKPPGGEPSGDKPWKPTGGEQPSGDKPTGGEQPSGNKPSGNKPTGEQPSGNKPTGEQPSGHKPTGEQPSGNKPTGEQPSGHKPTGEQPSGNKPTGGEQPSGNKPAGGEQPSGNKPSGNKPAESPAATTTMNKTIVKTMSAIPETTLTVVPVRPSGSQCPGGPDCPAPSAEHNKCSGADCPPSGTSVPSASVVKPSIPVVTGGASSVAAGLVALVAAQIFLL
ncbi:Endochitinase A [Beauveria bassiana]|nr:Endochitinase A [Beauveria bassiana]